MRTTVDLPSLLHQRVRELAHERGESISSIVAQLTARGLGDAARPLEIRRDPRTGFPVVSLGRVVTSEEVAETLDDE